MVRTESSPIVRLSTRDIAPADRLNYGNWILSVTDETATTEVSADDPSAFELEATALELPAVTIVAMSGSPQHCTADAPCELRHTARPVGDVR